MDTAVTEWRQATYHLPRFTITAVDFSEAYSACSKFTYMPSAASGANGRNWESMEPVTPVARSIHLVGFPGPAPQPDEVRNMGQRLVRFSDLTNKIIEDDAVVRLVVEKHPALENGPVEIEASRDEVEPIRKKSLDVVSIKVFMGDGSEPETVTMEIEAFNKLSGDMDMIDVIRRAQPAYAPRRQVPAAPAAERLDYSSLDHAGKPHRGKTTDAEKELIRNNLDKINERLERDGMRTIKLDDAEMVTRYGLEALAKEAGHFDQ